MGAVVIYTFQHRLTILHSCGELRLHGGRIDFRSSKTEAKFSAFKTEENEIKTHFRKP